MDSPIQIQIPRRLQRPLHVPGSILRELDLHNRRGKGGCMVVLIRDFNHHSDVVARHRDRDEAVRGARLSIERHLGLYLAGRLVDGEVGVYRRADGNDEVGGLAVLRSAIACNMKYYDQSSGQNGLFNIFKVPTDYS